MIRQQAGDLRESQERSEAQQRIHQQEMARIAQQNPEAQLAAQSQMAEMLSNRDGRDGPVAQRVGAGVDEARRKARRSSRKRFGLSKTLVAGMNTGGNKLGGSYSMLGN